MTSKTISKRKMDDDLSKTKRIKEMLSSQSHDESNPELEKRIKDVMNESSVDRTMYNKADRKVLEMIVDSELFLRVYRLYAEIIKTPVNKETEEIESREITANVKKEQSQYLKPNCILNIHTINGTEKSVARDINLSRKHSTLYGMVRLYKPRSYSPQINTVYRTPKRQTKETLINDSN
ncbi:hypothetical protein TCON_2832, partial [Astathelohania contejeani]